MATPQDRPPGDDRLAQALEAASRWKDAVDVADRHDPAFRAGEACRRTVLYCACGLVNREKSRVDRAMKRTFLGFGFLRRGGEVKVRVDPKARSRAKDRLRELTARTWGVPMERRIIAINRFTVGWTAYFALAGTPRPFRDLDEWLRRRLRQVRWKEWKVPKARRRNLVALGIPPEKAREWAGSGKGPWRIAGSAPLQRALPNAHWTNLGLQGFSDPYHRFRDAKRTAGCGPACPVVWEGLG